jgi:hypothetical protein
MKPTPTVRRIFAELCRRAKAARPSFRCSLYVAPAKHFPAPRDFAYCERTKSGAIRIGIAPKLQTQPEDRIAAVLAHEIGHAMFFACGEPRHAEREADKLAEAVVGRRIRYDRELVQSFRSGVSPRPRRLPK